MATRKVVKRTVKRAPRRGSKFISGTSDTTGRLKRAAKKRPAARRKR